MPRRKGFKCDEQTRKNMAEAALSRPSKLCGLYGFTAEYVRERKAEGLIWCSRCKAFAEGKRYRCDNCTKLYNKESYAKEHPQERKVRRKGIRKSNPERSARMDRKQQLRRFGFTITDYENLLAEQNGGCAICGSSETQRRLAVDHNHICCKQKRGCDTCRRGLLCHRCNLSLERIESFPDWPERARAYLRRYALDGTVNLSVS